MDKIINFLGQEQYCDCMGCDIANHKLIPPGEYVYEDGFINVSADPIIPIEGFMIIGIKKHVKSMNDLNEFERNEITRITNKTIEIIKKLKIADEVLVINEERAAHFHVWVVPILEWMEKFNKSVKNINEIINYAKQNNSIENQKKMMKTIEKIKFEFNSVRIAKKDYKRRNWYEIF